MNNDSKIAFSRLVNKNEYYIITAFFVFTLSLLLFLFFTPNYHYNVNGIEVNVKKGMTLNEVADTLYEKNVIPSKFPFKVSAFFLNAEEQIKAGRYEIPDGLSYFEIVELLKKGVPSQQTLVTIPEGIWQHKLAGLLQKKLGLDSLEVMRLSFDKRFLRSAGIDSDTLEGYLLPETYYFTPNSSERTVLKKLVREMDKLFTDYHIERMKELKMTKHQILTMASIIEAESNIPSEFAKISGVYHNRLKKGIALQADPTVQYLKRHRKKYNRVLYKDLEINSPYNTYKYSGLPPTPINNPGKQAVLAALYPQQHDYYYFVADGTGSHRFAKTISEHNRNVQAYREWRRTQR